MEEEQEFSECPKGTFAIWPPSSNSQKYSWSVVPDTLRALIKKGAVKTGRVDLKKQAVPIYYLSFNQLAAIEDGRLIIVGETKEGSLEVQYAEGERSAAPRTVWNMTSHDAGSHGTSLLRSMTPDRRFPFPNPYMLLKTVCGSLLQVNQTALS